MDEETKNKIKELEEELENKEIMINALLNEIKIMKNKRKNDKENEIKRIKRESNGVYRSFDNKNGWDMMSMDNNSWNTQPLETVTRPNTLQPLETVYRSNTLQPLENINNPNTLQPFENINRQNTLQPLEAINRPNTSQPLENINRSNTPPIVSQVKTSPIVSQSNRSNTPPVVSQVKTSPIISKVQTSPIKKKSKPLSVRDKKKIENILKEQLDSLINYKRVNKGLGNHCFFEEFVEFCVDTLPFTFGPSQLEIKQSVKNFMIQNNSRISGFICKNINSYSLLQIYSPLNCLSTILSPLESCVVFHDILLMIDDYTRLHFVFHSLFRNKIDNGVLGSTILNLISYQLKVDLDLYKSKKSIIQNLSSLKCNYELPKSTKSLEDYLLDLTKPIPVFNKKMINENIYEYVFSIRMLTHYLDWDYTFNTYFNEILYPKLEEDDSYLLYLGICNFNFYRIFGEIESTGMVNDLIKSKMEKVSTTSILSYLLIKQIDPLIASIWLEENTKELISQGWSIEYLTKYLLF